MNKNFAQLILSAAVISAMHVHASAQRPQQKTNPPSPFEQGSSVSENRFPAAYNAKAALSVQQGWDFFFTGSFTYWYVNEIGFDLGYTRYATPYEYRYQNNTFSPGFKAGLGMNFNYDGWMGFAEYTWLRNHTTSKASFPGEFFGSSLLTFNPRGYSTSRRIHLDLIDVTLSRPLYQGRDLTVLPSFGLRTAWIRQAFRATTSGTYMTGVIHAQSRAWFIGPNAGIAAHWLLNYGLRLQGDLGGALLYEEPRSTYRVTGDQSIFDTMSQHTLTPVLDLSLGFGWGTYLSHQKSHLDLVATYDFMNWWEQNFLRATSDNTQSSIGAEPGDLQINGLTVTARFDF